MAATVADFLTPAERVAVIALLRDFRAKHPEADYERQVAADRAAHDSLTISEQSAVNLMPHDANAPVIDFSKVEHYHRGPVEQDQRPA